MALTGNTMSATVNGYRARASKVWYPTNGNWVADGGSAGITLSASRATTDGTTTSGNKYGQIIKITTPNDASISSIQSITINFYCFDRNSTKGTLYGSLRTTYTDSTSADTDAFFRTNAIGSEASIATLGTTETKVSFTFSGSLSKNTSYYLFLYTKSTNDIYGFNNTFIDTASITYTKNSYTVKYDANGGSGAPSSQTKIYGETLTLSSTKPTKSDGSTSSTSNFDITGNANGGYFGTSTTTTTKITASKTQPKKITYTFSKWNTASGGSGTDYSAGGSYTANSGATLYAQYTSTTSNTGTASYSNNNIGALSKPTRAQATVATYTVEFDCNGLNFVYSDKTANKKRSYTFGGWATSADATSANASASYTSATTVYAYWTHTDSTDAINLPTPTRDGYTFMGWATTAGAKTADIGTGSYTPTGNITLYAVWGANNSTIHYNNNGTDTLCYVYYNDNGTAVACIVYYNNNGTAVRI